MAAPERRFRYARDPVCLIAVGLYLVNRLLIKPATGNPGDFWHCYANDVLCLPFWLPPVLWLQRRLHLRRHDLHPSLAEIGMYWLLWSWCFEGIAPELLRNSVSDPWDVAAYGFGGALAACVWQSEMIATVPAGRGCWQQLGAVFAIFGTTIGLAMWLWRHGARPDFGVTCRLAVCFAAVWLVERAMTKPPFRRLSDMDVFLYFVQLVVALLFAFLIMLTPVFEPGVH